MATKLGEFRFFAIRRLDTQPNRVTLSAEGFLARESPVDTADSLRGRTQGNSRNKETYADYACQPIASARSGPLCPLPVKPSQTQSNQKNYRGSLRTDFFNLQPATFNLPPVPPIANPMPANATYCLLLPPCLFPPLVPPLPNGHQRNTKGTAKNTQGPPKNTKKHLNTLKEQPLAGGPTAHLTSSRSKTCNLPAAPKRSADGRAAS